MALQIINRRGYLHEWNQAEAASPPTGNLTVSYTHLTLPTKRIV